MATEPVTATKSAIMSAMEKDMGTATADSVVEVLVTADLVTADLVIVVLDMVDLAMADLAMEDLVMEDLAIKDLVMVDSVMEDLAMADLAMEDLAMVASEDLVIMVDPVMDIKVPVMDMVDNAVGFKIQMDTAFINNLNLEINQM